MASEHWKGWDHDHRISGYWSPRIQAALRQLIDLGLITGIRPGGGRDGALLGVRSILARADRRRVTGLLTRLYLDAEVYGAWVATDQMKAVGVTTVMPASLARAFARAKAARFAMGVDLTTEVDPVTLRALETEADKVAGQILESLGERVAKVLADGWARDATVRDLARDLTPVVDSASRADLIAVTETARSMVAASFDVYQRNGVQLWDWLDSPGACPYCVSMAAGGPYALGEPGPPGHPRCRCAPKPRVSTPGMLGPATLTGVSGIGGLGGSIAGIAGVAGTILAVTGHSGSTSSVDTSGGG